MTRFHALLLEFSALEHICRSGLTQYHIRGEWFRNEFNIAEVMQKSFDAYPYAMSKLIRHQIFEPMQCWEAGEIIKGFESL